MKLNEDQLRRVMLSLLDWPSDEPGYVTEYMRIRRRAAKLQKQREVQDKVDELRRLLLPAIMLVCLLIPAAQGFTWAGDFNYQPPGGGTLHFASDFTSTGWGVSATYFRWSGTVYGGLAVGILGADVSTGAVMNVTGITESNVTYTVAPSPPGVATTRIRCDNRAEPSGVTGAFTWSYDAATYTVTVTTVGAGTVVVTWEEETGGIEYDVRGRLLTGTALISVSLVMMAAGVIMTVLREGMSPALVVGGLVAFILVAVALMYGILVLDLVPTLT